MGKTSDLEATKFISFLEDHFENKPFGKQRKLILKTLLTSLEYDNMSKLGIILLKRYHPAHSLTIEEVEKAIKEVSPCKKKDTKTKKSQV